MENPEDDYANAFDHVHDDSFMFNVKNLGQVKHTKMMMKRAKHCLALTVDPKDPYNQLILAIGGIYVTHRQDLFYKKTIQTFHDTNLVEYYSIKSQKWETYNSKLSLPRYSAAACSIKDYVYVVGGHKISQPSKFINTIERCHKNIPSSYFQVITVKQRLVNLSVQNQLAFPLPDDNGILILACQGNDASTNEGFFIDLKQMEMKVSKFGYQVGPINHWHNSCEIYERRLNFLTEQQQILRFETQSCEWSLIELAEVTQHKNNKSAQSNSFVNEYKIYEDGSHHYY